MLHTEQESATIQPRSSPRMHIATFADGDYEGKQLAHNIEVGIRKFTDTTNIDTSALRSSALISLSDGACAFLSVLGRATERRKHDARPVGKATPVFKSQKPVV